MNRRSARSCSEYEEPSSELAGYGRLVSFQKNTELATRTDAGERRLMRQLAERLERKIKSTLNAFSFTERYGDIVAPLLTLRGGFWPNYIYKKLSSNGLNKRAQPLTAMMYMEALWGLPRSETRITAVFRGLIYFKSGFEGP